MIDNSDDYTLPMGDGGGAGGGERRKK